MVIVESMLSVKLIVLVSVGGTKLPKGMKILAFRSDLYRGNGVGGSVKKGKGIQKYKLTVREQVRGCTA